MTHVQYIMDFAGGQGANFRVWKVRTLLCVWLWLWFWLRLRV